MFTDDDIPKFIKPKKSGECLYSPHSSITPKPIKRDVKVARLKQKRDAVVSLGMSPDTRRYYLQGYGAEIDERNPYERSATLAFHAWAGGFFDRHGF